LLPTKSTAAALHITIHLHFIQPGSCHAKSLWDRSLKTIGVEIGCSQGCPVANAFRQCSLKTIIVERGNLSVNSSCQCFLAVFHSNSESQRAVANQSRIAGTYPNWGQKTVAKPKKSKYNLVYRIQSSVSRAWQKQQSNPSANPQFPVAERQKHY